MFDKFNLVDCFLKNYQLKTRLFLIFNISAQKNKAQKKNKKQKNKQNKTKKQKQKQNKKKTKQNKTKKYSYLRVFSIA